MNAELTSTEASCGISGMNLRAPIQRILGTLIFAGLTLAPAYSQDVKAPRELSADEKTALIKEADATMDGFIKGDADAIIKRTSKLILKLIPSQEQFEKITRDAVAGMKAQGVSIDENKNGEPTLCYSTTSGDVCFLPRSGTLSISGRRIKSTTYFICVHEDGSWKFLDSATVHKQPELLWQLIPDLPKDLKLPPNSMEVLP